MTTTQTQPQTQPQPQTQTQTPAPCYYDAGEVFSGQRSGQTILGWTHTTPYTPEVSPAHVFPAWTTDLIVALKDSREPLFIYGPTGCGKTSTVRQVAAKLLLPVYQVVAHQRLEMSDLIGHFTVTEGRMRFVDGPLTMALQHGGLFLLDEADLLDPSTAAGLNAILDGSPLCIAEDGGRIVPQSPFFRFIATGNSCGCGDDSGLYQGVMRQNLAFMDRFILTKADYLPAQVEEALIRSSLPQYQQEPFASLVSDVVRYAHAVRRLFTGQLEDGDQQVPGGQIEVTFSTRTLIRWCKMICSFAPLQNQGVDVIQYALDRSLIYRATPVTQVALRELKQRIFA